MAKGALTARQREVAGYIERFIDRHGYPPTVREIGDAAGIRNPHGVARHLTALEKKGVIERSPGAARGIRVLKTHKGIPLLDMACLGGVLRQVNHAR